MNDDQLLRYSRQINLVPVDYDGQQKLLNSRVLVVGMGGLGSPIAMYLAAAGVGHLTFADFDEVDLSNLQRQIAHTTDRIGQLKTHSAKETCLHLNPEVNITTINTALDNNNIHGLVQNVDVVVDGCDNFATRFLVNDACIKAGKPLVSGAAIRFEGQISVFKGYLEDAPCYRCLYRDVSNVGDTCSENGVLAPLVGIIGASQASETLKVLLGIGQDLTGRLLLLDSLHMEWREIQLKKDPQCPACGIQQS